MSTQDLVARRAALSDTKRALLQARLRGEAPAAAPRDVVGRLAGPGPVHPLSFAQERMWFLSQYDPDLPLYNVPVAMLVRADLDVDALGRALSHVVRRHEALRTVFRMVDGEPAQIVLAPFPIVPDVRDVRDRIGADFQHDVQRLVEEEGARPFDISTGPLIRVALLRINEERYAMVLTTHHIATDGWAYPIILGEMEAFYEDLIAGRTPDLPDPELRYADYAAWQRQYLQGEVLERNVRFWREHLAGAPDTEIAGDRPRPARQSFRGGFYHFRIPRAPIDAAHRLGTRESVTLNMVLLSCFDLLLAKYADADEVTIGTLLGNRPRPELEPVVGFFVNTGAVRLRMDGDPTFRELVGRARRMILDAGAHQELPFEKVVDAMGGPRDPGRQPLFQIMYFHHVYSTAYNTRSAGMATALDPQPIYENSISLLDTGAAQFDLTMVTLEVPDGLDCVIEYALDLFETPTAHTLARRFELLLNRATANPDLPISRLSILDDEEARLLRQWGTAAAALDVPGSVIQLLQRRAMETPDAPAVIAERETLTYARLMARVDALAARLRGAGVGPEARVAVLMERGADLLVAMTAVMRAGGVFVPVDPDLPAERIAWLLRDAGAVAVLTQTAVADRVPSGAPRVLWIDDVDPARPVDAARPLPVPAAESGAYVIYTSGSTGQPKGVVVSHGALANLAAGMAERYGLRADDRALQFASASFDVSLEEVFPTWAAGGAVVVRTDRTPAAGADFVRWAEAQGITVLNLPTAFWHEWVRELEERGMQPPRTLRLMIVGGERARPESFAAWARVAPAVPCLNGYGPTEATVTATVHAAEPGADPRMEVPIGLPVPGARAYVVDRRGDPVPPGVPGELCLGGAGVARGYLGRPALTAEKFVPDPFAPEAGSRMYRTGDRARWREIIDPSRTPALTHSRTGVLEFMGRVDDQVKVRGFRVEPGEIEAALRAHAVVRDAAVVAREDGRGGRRLVAYVTPAAAPDAAELRRHLRERLPEHMVPAAFVALDALPMTTSGKVDRRALPDPEPAAAAETSPVAYEAPRGAVEEALAALWAQALGREQVGVHENFFELGGDSILSILVVGRAAEQGIRFTPRQIFTHPTIAELATVVGTTAVVQAEQGPVTGPAPLTPAQHWFFAGEPVDAHHWNHAVFLRLPVDARADDVRGALAALLAHHDALRLRFERAADGWRQWHADVAEPVALDVVDLSGVAEDGWDDAVQPHAEAAQAGLDLARGPLVRAVLFQPGEGRAPRLLLVIHHLAVDAVSWSILLEDLETAYTRIAAGQEPRLPAKTTSFRAWAGRLAAHAASPELLREADFWRAAVPADAAPLPVDDPAAPDTEALAARVGIELDERETEVLLRDATAAYGTRMEDVLLAGLLRAYGKWSGRPSLLVELEGHGREELFEGVDLSRTVGWFTATYPLHLGAPLFAGPGDVLKAVKEQVRAVPDRGMGWGMLRWMAPDDVRASLAALPWPEVSFNYLGQQGGGSPDDGHDGVLAVAGEAPGRIRSPRQARRERLSIDASVVSGRLRVGLFYGGRVYREETMRRLADAYAAALRELASHCASGAAGGFTPSDFPEAGLDQDTLDALFAQLGDLG